MHKAIKASKDVTAPAGGDAHHERTARQDWKIAPLVLATSQPLEETSSSNRGYFFRRGSKE